MTKLIQNGISFELDKNDFTSIVMESSSVSNTVYVPRSIFYASNEYIVVQIGEKAFEGNQLISSLIFDDNSEVNIIKKDAFKGSTLKYLSISSNLKNIEEGWCTNTQFLTGITVSPQNKNFQLINDQILVFSNDESDEKTLIFALRNVTNVEIPSYITKIATNSFDNCNRLISLSFSNDSKLRSIGQKSFQFSIITKLSFPPSLEFLEEGWCCNMSKLVDIEISPKNKNFKYIDDTFLVGKGKEKDETVLLFVKRDIVYCVVPSCVTRIGQFSFGYCKKLNSISFKEDSQLKTIGDSAFYDSSLISLSIPPSLERMDTNWCLNLNFMVSICVSPKNKKFVFVNESFLIFEEKILIFARRDIQKAVIPSFITHIGKFAFKNCFKLREVLFERDSSLVEIGNDAFNCCSSLTKISPFSVNLKRICPCAFQFCDEIESILFDLSSEDGKDSLLEIIDESAFDSCQNLKEVSTIPKSVKKIGNYAFGGCEQLKSFSFQDGCEIEIIGKSSFSHTSILSIPIPSKVQGLAENFSQSHNNILFFDIWPGNKYNEFIDQNYLVTKINDEIILNYVNPDVEDVLIPSKITRIGKGSFRMCKDLNSVSFEENSQIKSIGEKAFCFSSLKILELPKSLEILEDDWCFAIRSLINIKLSPDNENFELIDNKFLIRKNVNNKFFNGDDFLFACRDIETACIPPNIARIENNAFFNCLKLKSISFIDCEFSVLKEICKYSFDNCRSLKSIISIPSSLKIVENFSFSNCRMLLSCEFLSDELIFYYGSFLYCNSLSLLAFPSAKKVEFGFNSFLQIQKEVTIFTEANSRIQLNTM